MSGRDEVVVRGVDWDDVVVRGVDGDEVVVRQRERAKT